MSSSIRTSALAATAILAALAVPAIASAQHHLSTVHVSPSAAAEAGVLHARAVAAGDSLNQLRKASRLHEQSADLRPAEDPQAFECLRQAALLRYYSGDRRGAIGLMERAAQLAADRGDVITAARSFSTAAIMAHETKQPARAWTLGVRAELLTASPLLTEAQRLALRSEIVKLDRSAQQVSVR
ncbi:MAG TPA: hypothetical protein VFS08_02535 [Gemmatimonadaceae bacterium]|nr:hypothetical protein [Gemmatimonadaceae bacterium]